MNFYLNLFFVVVFIFCVNQCKGQEQQCDCTLYYLCDMVNTVPSSKCQGSEVCCRPEGPTKSPVALASTRRPNTTPKSRPTTNILEIPVESNCDCMATEDCPEVSGANQLDVRLGGSKSKCPSNQVCCPKRNGNTVEKNTGGGSDGGGTNVDGNNGNDNIGGGNNGNNNIGGGNKGNSNTGGGNNANGNIGGASTGDGNIGGGDTDFQECGIRRPPNQQFTSFRITSTSGMSETFFGEYPWMMAVLVDRTNKNGSVTENVFQCGATLILPNVVMTAAHCVYNLDIGAIKVRAGEWDTINVKDTKREPFPYQERTVSQMFVHDKFERASVFNDIALLMLDFPLEIKDHIGQICTPNFPEEYDPNDCLVTGWGKDKFGMKGQFQSTLRKVDLKLVPRDICQQKLRETRLGPAFKLHDSFLCAAGGPNQDACKGDGGGPLVCRIRNDKDRYTQVGIVAWGIGCGSETPGVYVDVSKFKKWILDNSHGNVFDTRIKKKN